ncbi:MAG: cytochrome-c peroxidase [Thermoanaerobaculia bacterium]|nr:cytochrome-c peroxidase [Thermoanaerobaculia bacterium]
MKLRELAPSWIFLVIPLLLAGLACGGADRAGSEAAESVETAKSEALTPDGEAALHARATQRFFPLPEAAPNPENPVTQAKVELGRRLYVDPRLSAAGTISCNSCHDLATYGVDNLPTSPGDQGQLGDRNSPTVFNAALHLAQFWDGRAADVEEQAGMPILNPVEMAIASDEALIGRLAAVEGYPEAFAQAFPEDDPALTYGNIARALGAFERTLLTPAPFDDYLAGDLDAIDAEAKRGLDTFMSLGCSACHNGYTMGGYSFRKFGLHGDYWVHTGSQKVDDGRFAVTGAEEDRYVFKVAALRNVEKTAPYFHDGSVATLEEALRVMGAVQLERELTDDEVSALAAFLRTLTGEPPASALATAGP